MLLQYLFAVLVVIVIILIVYWLFTQKNSASARRRRAAKLMNYSAGGFDPAARAAVDELRQINEMTPNDHFRLGYILQHNVLGGDRAVRQRRDIVHQIAQHYVAAVTGLLNRDRTAHDTTVEIAPEFIVHRIGNFVAADPMQFFGTWPLLNTVHNETAQERAEAAAQDADTRAEAVGNYFDVSTQYTSDPQNVHDSNVNSDLRRVLDKLRASTPVIDVGAAIDEARSYILGIYPADPQKVQSAMTTLDKIAEDAPVGTFQDCTEGTIFALVWGRTKNPANADRAAQMREAVYDALADAIEHGSLVCTNGRSARLLNAFTLLDFDPDVSHGAMTFEAYRNQIFQETKGIIAQGIDWAAASDDPGLQVVVASYKDPDAPEAPDAATDKFQAWIKSAIDANLERYKAKLSQKDMDSIASDCYVYAAI